MARRMPQENSATASWCPTGKCAPAAKVAVWKCTPRHRGMGRRAADQLIHQSGAFPRSEMFWTSRVKLLRPCLASCCAGDALAMEIWDGRVQIFGGRLQVNIAHTLDPQTIVLGGGMSKAGDSLLQPVRTHFQYQY